MNKALVTKLKRLKSEYLLKQKSYYDDEIKNTSEFKKVYGKLEYSAPIEPNKKINEPCKPEKLYFKYNIENCYKRNGNKEFELFTLDEYIRNNINNSDYEEIKKRSALSERIESSSNLGNLKIRYVWVLLISWLFCLVSVILISFPYIFHWSLDLTVALNLIGGMVFILGELLTFYNDKTGLLLNAIIGPFLYLREVFKQIRISTTDVINRELQLRFKEDFVEYIENRYPVWFGYPVNFKEFYLEFSKKCNMFNEEEIKNAFSSLLEYKEDENNYYFKIKEENEKWLTNSERNPNKEPHVAPSGYYDYINDYKKYETNLKKYNKNNQEWEEYKKYKNYYDNAKIEHEKQSIKKAREVIEAEQEKRFNDFIGKLDIEYPEKYYYCLDDIIEILELGKANDLGSAFAYKEMRDLEQRRIEALKPKKYRVTVVYDDKIPDIIYGRYKREERTTTVDVVANSEAEAIIAAKNMIEGAKRAYLR